MENAMIGRSLFVGQQVELTSLDPEKDSAVLSIWARDPIFYRRMFRRTLRPMSIPELKKKLQETLKEADEKHEGIYFAVRKIDTPEIIGLIWYPWIDGQHQTSYMGIAFGSDEEFDAYSVETMKLALYYAFMELSLHRLVIVARGNEPKWIELVEKFGFLREVQRRENVFSQGRYFDEYVYALLKSEWKQKQNEVIE